jgi:hypothetical protein
MDCPESFRSLLKLLSTPSRCSLAQRNYTLLSNLHTKNEGARRRGRGFLYVITNQLQGKANKEQNCTNFYDTVFTGCFFVKPGVFFFLVNYNRIRNLFGAEEHKHGAGNVNNKANVRKG